jgi:hypothetical protein
MPLPSLGLGQMPLLARQSSTSPAAWEKLPRRFLIGRDRRAAASPSPSAASGDGKRVARRVSYSRSFRPPGRWHRSAMPLPGLGLDQIPLLARQSSTAPAAWKKLPRRFLIGRDCRAAASPSPSAASGDGKRVARRVSYSRSFRPPGRWHRSAMPLPSLGLGQIPRFARQSSTAPAAWEKLPRRFLTGRDRRAAASPSPSAASGDGKRVAR